MTRRPNESLDTYARRQIATGTAQLLGPAKRSTGQPTRQTASARRWSHAKATRCTCGRIHPSKTEARVCKRLRATLTPGETLHQQVRFPLPNLAPQNNRTQTVSVDFAIAEGARWTRLIDAKPASGWKSRDWRRGKAAIEAHLKIQVEEASS